MTHAPEWLDRIREPHRTAAKRYYEGSEEWTPTTEQDWWYSLEILPPLDMGRGFFVMCEPLTHDDKGRPVLAVYRRTRGDCSSFYELRYEARNYPL